MTDRDHDRQAPPEPEITRRDLGTLAAQDRLRAAWQDRPRYWLITGPAGSGKTRTLQQVVLELQTLDHSLTGNRTERRLTVENPVEFKLPMLALQPPYNLSADPAQD